MRLDRVESCSTLRVLQLHGGIGIIHANFSSKEEQAKEVNKVKVSYAQSSFVCLSERLQEPLFHFSRIAISH